jgi:glycosyltransferase involved in cell wall biosynthesis
MVLAGRLDLAAPRSPGEAAPRSVVYAFLDLGDGGAQRLTLAAANHLDPARFAPRFLALRGRGRLVDVARAEGFEVDTLSRLERPWDLGAVDETAAALRALRPAIVHVPLYSRASPYARLAARRAGVPLVIAHEWSRPERPRWSRRVADRWLRPGTRFIAASDAQRRDLAAGGVRPERIAVVRAGIEIAAFEGRGGGAIRGRLGIGREPLLLVPARLHAAKGHDDLLAALPAVRARHPGVRVVCAGSGPRERELPDLARAAGLGEVVRFLGHRDDLPELYAAADLVVLPSRCEGLPSVLLEAWAARRAVVATAVGGVPEALTDGVEGRLVGARDPAALAAAIVELLAQPVRRAAMAERGRRKVEREFRVESSARRLEEVYEAWLREVAPPAAR